MLGIMQDFVHGLWGISRNLKQGSLAASGCKAGKGKSCGHVQDASCRACKTFWRGVVKTIAKDRRLWSPSGSPRRFFVWSRERGGRSTIFLTRHADRPVRRQYKHEWQKQSRAKDGFKWLLRMLLESLPRLMPDIRDEPDIAKIPKPLNPKPQKVVMDKRDAVKC